MATPYKMQKYFMLMLLLTFIAAIIIGMKILNTESEAATFPEDIQWNPKHNVLKKRSSGGKVSHVLTSVNKIKHVDHFDVPANNVHMEPDANRDYMKMDEYSSDKLPPPNYDVHVFYYPWYGSPETDGKYIHWNHPILPHWEQKVTDMWPKGEHVPPGDVGASFYPSLGPYSSRDESVIAAHMRQIRLSGAGVLAVSWYPPGTTDEQGKPSDDLMPVLLDHANKWGLKVCFHVEPYKTRDEMTWHSHLKYIVQEYGQHPGLYRRTHNGKELPLYYMYDSYTTSAQQWSNIFTTDGENTVRGTDLDGIFIGLLVEPKHKEAIVSAGFDGFYTYFASDGFTYASTSKHWGHLAQYAVAHKLLFIPSVGPGYDDERIRPWNGGNTKDRGGGRYYEAYFENAVNSKPPMISVTSFNEWHEGTQIEEAIPKSIPHHTYKDYAPHQPNYYLSLTRKWVFKYKQRTRDTR